MGQFSAIWALQGHHAFTGPLLFAAGTPVIQILDLGRVPGDRKGRMSVSLPGTSISVFPPWSLSLGSSLLHLTLAAWDSHGKSPTGPRAVVHRDVLGAAVVGNFLHNRDGGTRDSGIVWGTCGRRCRCRGGLRLKNSLSPSPSLYLFPSPLSPSLVSFPLLSPSSSTSLSGNEAQHAAGLHPIHPHECRKHSRDRSPEVPYPCVFLSKVLSPPATQHVPSQTHMSYSSH